jgi:hypothetical protein
MSEVALPLPQVFVPKPKIYIPKFHLRGTREWLRDETLSLITTPVTVGQNSNVNASSSIAFTSATNAIAAGDKGWFFAAWQGTVTLSTMVAGGVSCVIDAQGANGNTHVALCSGDFPSGMAIGSTVTATFSGASTGSNYICGMTASGVASGGGNNAVQNSQSATASWTTTSTPVANSSILISVSYIASDPNSASPNTASGGNTKVHDFQIATDSALTTEYKIGSGASISGSGTWSSTGTIRSIGVVFDPSGPLPSVSIKPSYIKFPRLRLRH